MCWVVCCTENFGLKRLSDETALEDGATFIVALPCRFVMSAKRGVSRLEVLQMANEKKWWKYASTLEGPKMSQSFR